MLAITRSNHRSEIATPRHLYPWAIAVLLLLTKRPQDIRMSVSTILRLLTKPGSVQLDSNNKSLFGPIMFDRAAQLP